MIDLKLLDSSAAFLLNHPHQPVNLHPTYPPIMGTGNHSQILLSLRTFAFAGVATACSNLCNGDSTCGAFWLEASYPTFTCKTVKKTCNIVEKMVDAPQGVIFLVKA